MPVYGSIAAIKQALQPTATTAWTADQDATLLQIQRSVSLAIEEECGRTFGNAVPDTAKLLFAGPVDTIVLPVPARSITSVAVGGYVSAGTVTGGLLYDPTSYACDPVDRFGNVLGLRLVSGGCWGASGPDGSPWTPVLVTGDFSDSDDDEDVPADVTDVANFLVAETYKYRGASPAGFVGPDGSVVPIRDPWKDPLVVRTLKKYSLSRRVAGF